MAENKHSFIDLAAQRGLDVDAPLSPLLVQALDTTLQPATLATVLPSLQQRLAAAVPELGDALHVRYLLRETGEVFSTTVYAHDPVWLDGRLRFHLGFLGGGAVPECAQLRALCFHCTFWNSCRAGRVVLGYPPTRPY